MHDLVYVMYPYLYFSLSKCSVFMEQPDVIITVVC